MQAGVLDDISKQMGLWAQLRHIASELRAIRGGGAARKASALRAMLRCPAYECVPQLCVTGCEDVAAVCLRWGPCLCNVARHVMRGC